MKFCIKIVSCVVVVVQCFKLLCNACPVGQVHWSRGSQWVWLNIFTERL